MTTLRSATILGGGSWGTTIAMLLADAGLSVTVWARREDTAAAITRDHVNPFYLPDIALPESVTATTDLAGALAGADLVAIAVPAQQVRAVATLAAPHIPGGARVLSLAKGLELGSAARMSEVLAEVAGITGERLAVLTGPSLAPEVAARNPLAGIVASVDATTAQEVSDAFAATTFRAFVSSDVIGCEIAAATKNVIAVAVGAAEGLQLGTNTKSTLITRGLAETVRLGVALGADPATFSGLAGVGDLIATCMSPLSRNHRVGVGLGRGRKAEEIVAAVGQTAEGVTSCEAILALAGRHGVDVPIVEAVVAMVVDGQRPELIADALMSRERKAERTI